MLASANMLAHSCLNEQLCSTTSGTYWSECDSIFQAAAVHSPFIHWLHLLWQFRKVVFVTMCLFPNIPNIIPDLAIEQSTMTHPCHTTRTPYMTESELTMTSKDEKTTRSIYHPEGIITSCTLPPVGGIRRASVKMFGNVSCSANCQQFVDPYISECIRWLDAIMTFILDKLGSASPVQQPAICY